ncbi:hypothetical protein [Saccharopolyspora spinosa]|uniref:Uncharacterized protein n=1 Tax=Saccharopolyspora spinosa TaxID=60894 RepID=A0A2N3XYZ9_SACSN|nr:hypothetical protein [Saccharopolyspora spinosa]PKW15840.1 hypothetical protein A8926_3611 [Saccharopolyspora spinosa]
MELVTVRHVCEQDEPFATVYLVARVPGEGTSKQVELEEDVPTWHGDRERAAGWPSWGHDGQRDRRGSRRDEPEETIVDERQAKGAVVAAAIGNTMEWFDFGVYSDPGFSTGGEYGGAATLVSEHSPDAAGTLPVEIRISASAHRVGRCVAALPSM